MFYVLFDEVSSIDKNIAITKRPDIPAPSPRYSTPEIKGRDGNYYEFDETYEDIEIEIDCNYITEPENWHKMWRSIKSWLLTGKVKEMQFSDDLSFFYVVKKISLNTNEREFSESGEFTINVTVAPYEYLVDGKKEYEISQVKNNAYNKAFPVYKIAGNGICKLTVNGKTVSITVSKNATVNTELRIAYNDADLTKNADTEGYLEDLFLQEGSNTITHTDGFTIKVIPNWRCI